MIELSIPQLGEETKQVKDLVFTVLTDERSLSLIELTNKIKKQYTLGITYQAVRKAVNLLHQQKILEKKGKRYSLSKEWVLKAKSFFDKLLTTYETKTSAKLFSAELAKEDYAVYTFNNILDLDLFWGEIMTYWADHAKENKNYFSYVHYHWWMLINLGHETRLFENFRKRGIKGTLLTPKDLPLNRWATEVYKQLGLKTKITEIKEKEPFVDINLLGDTIIQVNYPPELIKKLKTFFEKYKTVQEVSMKEIAGLAHESHEIKFVVFKNAVLAKSLWDNYLKYFKKV